MRKLIIITMISALTIVNFVGCSDRAVDSSVNNSSNQQEVKTDSEKFKEEEEKYSELLTSGKTYEEMDGAERSDFSLIIQTPDKFTQEFKEKYREDIDRIEVSMQEAVAKWKAEKEEVTETIQRENIIGTSNKSYQEIDTAKPSSVRNDVTGNWRISKIATNENIVEYTKSYYENNFSDDKEIHAIVNFTLNTTTKVSKVLDNILSVTVHEYVDKEEHDANELFSGMVLADYFVYLDNGDIEEIK